MTHKNNNQHSCIYHKNKNGMGGIAVNKLDKTEYTISIRHENYALDGDEVTIRDLRSGHQGSEIVEIIKHNTTNLSGFIQKYKDKFLLKVVSHKFGNYLVIVKSKIEDFDREELYNTVITSYPNEQQPFFEVELVNKIGFSLDDEAFINDLLISNQIPVEFSAKTIAQTNAIRDEINPNEIVGRNDLRDLPFVTIDGADAKDFDDAVFVDIRENDFILYVAIADVSHYVTFNSALDRDAYLRGTSIYFPKQVIPMLPEHLSNGVCSLNPEVDRLTMCCEMKINQEGIITDYKIYNAIINSKARLTYNKVQEWINELSLVPNHLISNVTNLYLVFQKLTLARKKRGAIDFNSLEPIFKFDADGMVDELQPRVRLESHKLIEECMLAANVSVADFFIKNNMATLFRIHPKPSEEKFDALKSYLNSIAIPFDIKYSELTPYHIATLMHLTQNHANHQSIEQIALRSMQLATYSVNNVGHFGLSYDKYLHFTSPIRRYPDLLVHRALKDILVGNTPKYIQDLVIMGEQTSYTERRAEDISRKVDAFYKCQYANTHIGKTYAGVISSVVGFGLFVYIPSLMLDGLLHVTNLEEDYFVFNEEKQVIVGKKTGITYKPGQEIYIEIVRVDMVQLFIDFKLAKTTVA